eukprot:COSAG06_NODE_59310_length_274_cov_1.177143_1_plen_26_part_10
MFCARAENGGPVRNAGQVSAHQLTPH